MNENILRLMREALCYKTPNESNFRKDEILKFAELIVNDCLKVVNQPNGVSDDDVIKISRDIKSHFGVE